MLTKYLPPLNGTEPNVTFIFDIGSRSFVHLDSEFIKILGLEYDALTSKNIISYIFAEDLEYLYDFFTEVIRGIKIPSVEFRLNIHGQEKWIRLSALKLSSDDSEVLIGNAVEVTAEVENIWTIRKYTNKKNAMLTVLSHDLRGPLGIVRNLSAMLEKKMDDEKINRSLHTITKIVQESLDLINDLLAREVVDSTSSDVVKIRTDVALKVKEYMEEYIASEWMSQRTFKFNTSHESIMMGIDEAKFMQILNNLMSNAMKFTEPHSTISVGIEQTEDQVIMTFADDGIGIPAKLQPELFKKFTEAGRRGLNGEPSIGLGLYIVKSIVDLHEGTIRLESTEGQGTKFQIEFPKN